MILAYGIKSQIVGVRHFSVVSPTAFRRLLLFPVIVLMISPVGGMVHPEMAQAQSIHDQNRNITHRPYRRRVVRRNARRVVKKTNKSFFGTLFGNKPSRRRSPSRGVRGLNPLLGSLLGVQTSPHQNRASLRASYAKRMRDAAARDARLGNGRFLGRTGYPAFRGRGQYRTMCVRMCDGYYFPISFKARSRDFASDQQRCNSGCYNAPTKLFYYSNSGGSIEHMRALDGVRYKDIANAFKYRKKFVADCRCKAEPWTARAKQQHENWALVENHAIEKMSSNEPNLSNELDITSRQQASRFQPHATY